MENSVCHMNAFNLAQQINDKKVSSREVLEEYFLKIDRINPTVNAIVSIDKERAFKKADKADYKFMKGHPVGPFHGLPIAIKDNVSARGFPTTFGFSPLKDNIAKKDDLLVERLKNAGSIIIGKTNIPEFAAGGHTFNELFGITKNPYDLNRTAGGSSGGAAVAVTTEMLPFADGNDMGGSLRFPAAFNNVVGMRTSPGRIPIYPKTALYSTLGVSGPIARNVTDAAFMMSVIAGPDNRSPISIEESGSMFKAPFSNDLTGLRVAWSADFNGLIPVDPSIRENVQQQAEVFESLGCHVEEACIDFNAADEVFRVFRAWEFEMSNVSLYERYKEQMKPSFVSNFKQGQNLLGKDIGRAERLRNKLYHQMRSFFMDYDVLILPVSPVAPFDAKLEYPEQINGVPVKDYLDWLRSCYYISAIGNPALSIPSGFTKDGLPLGIQIIGPHQADYDVLQVGYAFEQATGYGSKRPLL